MSALPIPVSLVSNSEQVAGSVDTIARHAAGEDIVAIKDILGHSSIATTQIYLDALSEPTDDIAGTIAGLVLPHGLNIRLPEKAN